MIQFFQDFRAPAVLLSAFLSLVFASACSSDKEEVSAYVERPVEELYNQAMDSLQNQEYRAAAPLFDEVERQHPYSKWATKAQMMSAYSYYMSNRYDDAIIALDRYIQLHPSSEDVAYAHYLKALCHYEQITDITRDQKATYLAKLSLEEVIARFPNSRYAKDAGVKLDLVHDHLAGKEMEIGRFELKRGNHLAAINRFKRVIELYQTTTHVPEALHRMTEAYLALGLDAEARKAASVLGHNFPGSEWYEESYVLLGGERVIAGDAAKPKGSGAWYKFW